MARLRWPVSCSDRKTASLTSSGRPAKAETAAIIAAIAASSVSPGIRPAAAMAPALTMGLNGRPEPAASVMALNASPVGSTPMCRRTPASPMGIQGGRVDQRLGQRLEGERVPRVSPAS